MKHKAVIESAKYSVLKGKIFHQSFHDAQVLLSSFQAKVLRVLVFKHVPVSANDNIFNCLLSHHCKHKT